MAGQATNNSPNERRSGRGSLLKLLLISFDSTLRSNLSVGMPIDLLVYRKDALEIGAQRRIDEKDPYYRKVSAGWSQAIRNAFEHIDEFGDEEASQQEHLQLVQQIAD